MNLKKAHRVLGYSVLVIFLATGVFMAIEFPGIYGENQVVRFLFRANHVYILFAALLNIMAGFHLSVPDVPWRKKMQSVGSWLLLLSPALFLAAFIIEPVQASPMRPLTVMAAFMSLMGVSFLVAASWNRHQS